MMTLMSKLAGFIFMFLLLILFSVPAFADVIDNPAHPQYSEHRPESPHNRAQTGVKVETCQPGPFNRLCTLSTGDFGHAVGVIINFVFVIATVVALFYLIYGGLKWIMSEGDKSAVETARHHIVAAIIGLVVIFLAYFIINVLLGFFAGTDLQKLILPDIPSLPDK